MSEETRSQVLAAANRPGFEPNRLARGLATARSQTIGVVVHDVSDPYFAEMIRGMEDVAGPGTMRCSCPAPTVIRTRS